MNDVILENKIKNIFTTKLIDKTIAKENLKDKKLYELNDPMPKIIQHISQDMYLCTTCRSLGYHPDFFVL